MHNNSFVEVDQLSLTFPSSDGEVVSLFSSLTFSLPKESFLQLTGTSGVGKSTLLNILSGIQKGYEGEVKIGDCPPHDQAVSIAYVLQGYGLFPWKRVEENIFLPKELGAPCRSEEETRSIIRLLGIEPLLKRYPSSLSGGQKQRVALARAFGQRADLLLLDEPFAALDEMRAQEALDLLARLREYHPVTTIMATHHVVDPHRYPHYSLHLCEGSFRFDHPQTVLASYDEKVR